MDSDHVLRPWLNYSSRVRWQLKFFEGMVDSKSAADTNIDVDGYYLQALYQVIVFWKGW